jgi:hypothetical protein
MAATTTGDISEMGYGAIKEIDGLRNSIMSQVANVANNTTNDVNFSGMARMAGITAGTSSAIDITTGAGALVLDDVLQALSTVEQASAQLVSAENKAQQQVNSLARG